MDYQKWQSCTWDDAAWAEFAPEAEADIKAQLEANGLELLRVLPNQFRIGAIAQTPDKLKWLHITTADVREDAEWFNTVSLRRMSSERDWKGDEFHYCAWPEIGSATATYMGDEYDDEIL